MPSPVWTEAAPFRAWVRELLDETELHWRLYAALINASPTAIHRLLTEQRPEIHVELARTILATDINDLKTAEERRVPSLPSRRLLEALTTLGHTNTSLAPWLTPRDLAIRNSRALYCSRAAEARVQATYDYLTHVTIQRHNPYPSLDRKGA